MKKRRFKLLPGSVLYLILLIYSLILTQLLRNAVSGALFLFVLILPVISLIHCLIGRSAIQIYVESEKSRAEKNEPLNYEIRVSNSSILAYPFVEAVVSEPSDNAVKCTKKRLVLSFVPFGSFTVKSTVKFKYRGYYEIGVESLYISDLFRLFAVRADKDNYAPVSVYPRKMTIVGERPRSLTDSPSPSLRHDVTSDNQELTGIREYVPGDPIRDVHWKLSSKTQDLMVKQYSSVEDRHVYVLCDMARSYRPPEKRGLSDEYDRLKKYVDSESEKEKGRRLRRAINEQSEDARAFVENEIDKKPLTSDEKRDARAVKRFDAKYRKYIRSGMSEKEAETVKSIDELISASSKRKREKKIFDVSLSEKAEEPAASGASETESDLKRILELAEIPDVTDAGDRAFGGRVKESELDEYDEFCLDAVVERTLAEVLSELKGGCTCTVAWYDDRSESGIYSSTMAGSYGYDEIYQKLATASPVSHDRYVANLTSVISESVNVTVKIVTSNTDPESAALIGAVPSRFGGASTGCSVEVITYSDNTKFEDPALRAVYNAGVALEFGRRGIASSSLEESIGAEGTPTFVTAD